MSILLVEDNPVDVMMTREALSHHNVLNPLAVVDDGIAALQYLRRQGPYAEQNTPGLIILDLNLPKKSGREVLADIKADDALKSIPVLILTTSNSEDDITNSYGLYANCYITKPVDFSKFVEVVRAIKEFWLGIVTLPPTPA